MRALQTWALLVSALWPLALAGAEETPASVDESGAEARDSAAEDGSQAPADPAPEAPPGPFALMGNLEERFQALTHNEPALDGAIRVSNVTIEDRFMRWRLDEGLIAPLRIANGSTIGGWFQGSCTFSYQAPLGQERAALQRGTRRSEISDLPCTEAVFLTDDPEVLTTLGADQQPDEAEAFELTPFQRRLRKDAAIYREPDHFHGGFARGAIRRALGAVQGTEDEVSYLSLVVKTDDIGTPTFKPKREPLNGLSYRRDPGGSLAVQEQVVLTGFRDGPPEERYGLILCSHPWEGIPETAYVPPNLDMVSADLDIDIAVKAIELYATMDATATVTLTTRTTPIETVELQLLRTKSFKNWFRDIAEPLGFVVEEITDFKGRPLDFLHRAGSLIVRLRSPLPPGQAEVLKVRYTGNAMPRVGVDSFGLLASYPWWPQPQQHDRFTWSTTICRPPAFKVAGTGTTIKTWKDDKKKCERWEEPVPVFFPAINMGRWQTDEIEGPHGIRIRAFFLSEDDAQIEPALHQARRILEFYEQLFGPYPFAELDIAQSFNNQGYWQAPAGLLELSKSDWMVKKTARKDLRSDFYPHGSIATLAHEIGHQWWGHVVGWKTYRDQWISETFAEYASFLYMSQYYGEESYLGRLEWWEHAARKSDRYGPAVIGFRLGAGRTGQFYRRGPFILHMLRRMVGDKPFTEFTTRVTEVANNRNLSTADLETIAHSVLGDDVTWFLDQWLEQPGLPDLDLTWRSEGNDLFVTLKQTQPEPAMRLSVPIEVRGKKRKARRHVIHFDTREIEVELPLPGGVVKSVRIDPDREVLTGKKTVREAEKGAE